MQIKAEFLSSLVKGNTNVNDKVVDDVLANLIKLKPYDQIIDKNYIIQSPGTIWKIVWAPHIRLLESFIFWNSFITTTFSVKYKFGPSGEIISNAKYEMRFFNNSPFHSGNLNTKGRYCMIEGGSACKIVFDKIWLDFRTDKVRVNMATYFIGD